MNEVKLTDKQILLLEGDPAFAELVSAAKERLASTERFAHLKAAQRNLIAKIGKENVLFAKYIRPTEGYTLVKMPRRIYTERREYKPGRLPIRPIDYEAGNFPASCANLQLEW